MTSSQNTESGTGRGLLLVGVAVLALVVVTIAVVLLAPRATTEFPPDSPEAALQGYLRAFDEGDYEAAYAFFSDEIRNDLSLDDYERQIQLYGLPYGEIGSRRVLFDRSSGSGDRIRVHLTVEEFHGGGGLGGGSTYRSAREIWMVRQADGWRIDEPLVWLDPVPLFDRQS
jgi:hypothetical protein